MVDCTALIMRLRKDIVGSSPTGCNFFPVSFIQFPGFQFPFQKRKFFEPTSLVPFPKTGFLELSSFYSSCSFQFQKQSFWKKNKKLNKLALGYLPGGPPLKYFHPSSVSLLSSGWNIRWFN